MNLNHVFIPYYLDSAVDCSYRPRAFEKQDEVHQLATSIRTRFESLPRLSSKCCIYRIPQTLREANKSAYSPCLISIGPFHHGKKRLQPMEDQKLRYLKNFLRRNDERSLSDYLRFIRDREKEIREYYVEVINMGSEEFVSMFILMWHFDEADETDRIFEKSSLEYVVRHDILLLENQLPFFVLDGLYDIGFGDDMSSEMTNFIELCSRVLVGHNHELSTNFDNREFLHLVDFVRAHYLPSSLRDSNIDNTDYDDYDFDFPPGIEMLYNTGVRFEVDKSSPLLDIEFQNGVLRIPKLDVEDHTECLLLNLSAFEQCHDFFESYIVDYVVLMDVLITSLKDVDILMSNGIITNSLGTSEDLAEIFNTICTGTTYRTKGFYYNNICKELNKHAKMPWNKWRATLKNEYFGNPWNIISVIVAVVLLILTVFQTVCTIILMK
ncbi:hypothetical protein RND81_01G136200 [Saponaria officinalis]|uniref:Uncharacterized protein n=1 Tax=Saponaria officinalis TaxID=3572 RepID=A0AAW1N9S9_SAPOF